jgi:ADP-heptose:LPS heptosyltransferase
MKLASPKDIWVRKGTLERIAPLTFDAVKKIAIIKHGALGDLVHTRPMILTLRRYFPNAKITFSAISHYTNGIPEDIVDRVHITCGKEKKYSEREKFASIRALGAHDIIFDITQSSRSHWITRLNSAPLKIGFRHKGLERLCYDIAIHRAHYRFEAETFLEQLNAIGIDYEWPLEYGYNKLAPIVNGDYLLYFATASVDYKIWPKEHFSQLIDRSINDHPQYQHILLSGLAEWERDWANDIVARINHKEPLQIIAGGAQTEALIDNASCVIANDTGIRNLAIARGIPTLGLFLPSILFGYVPRFGIHEVAYDLDGDNLTVDEVSTKLSKLLHRIDNKAGLITTT